MKKRLFFLVMALVCSSSIVTAQSRIKFVADDGFEYYSVVGPGGFGAESITGRVIIPAKFGMAAYIPSPAGGWFYVYAQGGKPSAVYSKTGQCIIPLSRGYDDVAVRDEGWISVKKNGKYGACDMSGREFLPTIYNSLNYDEETGFQAKDDDGDYNDINVWIPGKGPEREDVVTTQDQNGAVPVFDGGNNSSYSNSSSSSTTNRQKQRKTCTRCHGEKRVVYERSVNAGYGLDRQMTTCPECGKSYDKTGLVHRHEPCTSCHGLGYYE